MPVTDFAVRTAGSVRVLTINRPESRNALSGAVRREFVGLLEFADADASVNAVVLTGADPAFSAGVDFKDIVAGSKEGEPHLNPAEAVRRMRKPVLCAVNGACFAGALEIALSATLIVASERALFADTHARLNVVPAWGMTALLPRAVGLRKAREMSGTGDRVGAEEALRIGLANHVVPHKDLLPFAIDLAARFASTNAGHTIRQILDRGASLGLDDALALEAEHAAAQQVDSGAFSRAGWDLMARGDRNKDGGESLKA